VTVIVSGHSLFFRTLFQAFMPHASDHEAKRKKVSNGGGRFCVRTRVASGACLAWVGAYMYEIRARGDTR
jgi:hypothetical protein